MQQYKQSTAAMQQYKQSTTAMQAKKAEHSGNAAI